MVSRCSGENVVALDRGELLKWSGRSGASRRYIETHDGDSVHRNTASGYDTINWATSTVGTTGSGSVVTGLLCTQPPPLGADLRSRSIKWLTTS